jgi:uncharacterized protein (TIGR02246 family)
MFRGMLVACFVIGASALCLAQDGGAADMSPDEAAIRANIKAYLDAFKNEDAAAAVALWTDAGEYLAANGELIKGHAELQKAFQQFFDDNQGVQIEVDDPTIQFPSPSVAVEEGVARIVKPDAEPETVNYTAVHVKTADGWKLDDLRESAPPPPTPNERLQELTWLLGDWIDADEESAVETTCEFTKNGNFIRRSFRISFGGEVTLEGTQVIGWDQSQQTFRSWVFDTEGGFGEGTWEHDGNRWIVQSTQTLSDGTKASSINIMEPQEDGSIIWQATGREVSGQPQPNLGPVTIVRR